MGVFYLTFKISWYLLLLFWDLDPDLKVSKLGFKKWFLKNNLPFFDRHFRFNKVNVERLADMLNLERETDQGSPLTPVQSVCIALNSFAGGHFQRISGYCGNVSQNAARVAINRVTAELLRLMPEYVRMPTVEEMRATATRMEEAYHLPGFAYGIDGMHVLFDHAPRGIPVGPGYPSLQNFFGRKMHWCINVVYVCGDRHIIYALDRDWHGAAHDSRIWQFSLFKQVIEDQPRFLLAGDSAFPISEVLIKPFTTDEAMRSARKRLFNKRHSALRTVMTENTFALLTGRWPCLKHMRVRYDNAKPTIDVTALLHNLSIIWDDELDDDMLDADGNDELGLDDLMEEDGPDGVRDRRGNAVLDVIRERGQLRRQQLLDGMPAARRNER